MASTDNSSSLTRMKPACLPQIQLPPDVKAESIGSVEPAPPTSGIPDIDTVAPQFDLDKTFPAILAPFSLLRGIRDSQDIDAMRALAPVFCHCLDAILHSMTHLPDHIPTSPKYHLALSGVKFSKDMFLDHVSQVHDRSSSQQEAIHVAMQYLDMAMSSLKGFLNAAAYEVAQLKPLPQIPVEDGNSQVSDESSSFSHSHSSDESQGRDSSAGTFASNSTDALVHSRKSKISTLLRPLSLRCKTKKGSSRPDLIADIAASGTPANESDDLSGGYVFVSVNIRNSLEQFPVSVDPSAGKMFHPEDSIELWKDRNGLAQLASLKALVRYMTSPNADSDVEIVDVFFLCFRFFSSPQETLDALVARYDEDLECQYPSRTQSHTMQIKMRIARLLYLWVDLHWRAEDAGVLSPLTQFAFSRLAQDIPRETSSRLVSSLHQRACAGENSRGFRIEKTIALAEAKHRQEIHCCDWTPQEKKSMMRGDFSKVKLEHFFSPGGHTMLALQLTILLWEKYRTFEPEDAVRYLMSRDRDDNSPTSEVARKVANFMAYERAVHRFVLNSIATAESAPMRTELTEFFLELATRCHKLRNYSASCLITLACDRPAVLPFITKMKLSSPHKRMKAALRDFYTRQNQHMVGYKQALQSCCCPALPGMMLFIREVARGCGSEPYEQHPTFPGPPLINLKRYRPLTWAVRAMEKCHAPFKIQRVDYICDWLEHVLSEYLAGTELEWEQRIHNNWYVNCSQAWVVAANHLFCRPVDPSVVNYEKREMNPDAIQKTFERSARDTI